jgi:hypothetical protein
MLPPAPDCKLWIYKSIFNIAFAKSRRGFIYKCLLLGCRFQTLVQETLKTHIEEKHKAQEWNGFCNTCTKEAFSGKKTILDEFQHMTESHIKSIEEYASFANSKPESVHTNIPVKSPKSFEKLETNKTSSTQLNLKLSLCNADNPDKVLKKSSSNLPQKLKSDIFKSKPKELTELMQSKEALCATYKCMSSTCSFFTFDRNVFAKHLSLHEKYTALDKINFWTCANCGLVGSSASDLIKHIDEAHVYDRFQCKYCFYRSCADFNVFNHQIMMHKGHKIAILECPQLKERDTSVELDAVKKSREENVAPLICVFCRGIFYAKAAFLDHVSAHADNLRARCITCGEKTSNKTIERHLEKCHGLGLFHCVYCTLGTDSFETLNNHIAKIHPSKLPVFCERTEHRNSDGTLKHVSCCHLVQYQIFISFSFYLAFTIVHRNNES